MSFCFVFNIPKSCILWWLEEDERCNVKGKIGLFVSIYVARFFFLSFFFVFLAVTLLLPWHDFTHSQAISSAVSSEEQQIITYIAALSKQTPQGSLWEGLKVVQKPPEKSLENVKQLKPLFFWEREKCNNYFGNYILHDSVFETNDSCVKGWIKIVWQLQKMWKLMLKKEEVRYF